MKLKTIEHDGQTFAAVQDGKPIYIDDDGKEVPFDAAHAMNKITSLNAESKRHREAKEEAENKLKAFDGIEDAAAARKALETVSALDSKSLVDAGKVEEIKAAAIRAAEEKREAAIRAKDQELEQIRQEREALQSTLNRELIGGNFSRSKFVEESIAIPPDMVQARFGQNFKVEDGRVRAYDGDGNLIYSRKKPGEPADFDEALETLVDHYPYKDHILKGRGQNGAGAGEGGPGGGSRRMSKAKFYALSPKDRAAKMAEPGFELTD